LYPSDTVYGRAATRLEEMALAVAEWGEGEVKPQKLIAESGEMRSGYAEESGR
jgi:hypothetical protein